MFFETDDRYTGELERTVAHYCESLEHDAAHEMDEPAEDEQ